MAPQFVKPFVKSNKNDMRDAEAIAEAVTRPTMRFVPIKEVDQQDIQALHRVRERLIDARTALINEVHGLMLEYGIVLPKGVAKFRQAVVEKLETALATTHPGCQRLMTIPRIGTITATALVAAVGAVGVCKNGRQFAAWLGLVPNWRAALTPVRPPAGSGPGQWADAVPANPVRASKARNSSSVRSRPSSVSTRI